ncbi:hypothetical protein GCM10022235_83010 [Kribbella ginsengisoli]|uniref:Uncharacterized protein n=1 Tax=Kribbella ginsengisoli TaxID=363865 RepID=A0ABP6Z8D6_9ACTN
MGSLQMATVALEVIARFGLGDSPDGTDRVGIRQPVCTFGVSFWSRRLHGLGDPTAASPVQLPKARPHVHVHVQ